MQSSNTLIRLGTIKMCTQKPTFKKKRLFLSGGETDSALNQHAKVLFQSLIKPCIYSKRLLSIINMKYQLAAVNTVFN